MRIIAGKYRAVPLVPPPGDATRPITDRAKQSLFDALQDCFAGHVVLDCFSGTGSMGLECLSRGAAGCVFIERNRGALAALKQNIAALHAAETARVLPIDAYAIGPADAPFRAPGEEKFTIAFIDPPYRHTDSGPERHKLDELIRTLAAHHMVDGGILSFQHPGHVSVDGPLLGVKIIREFRYGDMGITWLTHDGSLRPA